MRISLIVATLGRTAPLIPLLDSIASQRAAHLEVIVADQNSRGVLDAILAPYRQAFDLIHIHTEPGLSRSRNQALPHATGDVVAFPDDDCVYEPGTLAQVRSLLDAEPDLDGVTGIGLDSAGEPLGLRWPTQAEPVTKLRVWRQAISYTIFLRRRVVEAVGPFEETLGLGAGTPWISGEETDYVVRALAAGFSLRYHPAVRVRHPKPGHRFEAAGRARAYGYALGMGRVLKLHAFPLTHCLYYFLRPALGSLWLAARGRAAEARYYASVMRGRWQGWRSA